MLLMLTSGTWGRSPHCNPRGVRLGLCGQLSDDGALILSRVSSLVYLLSKYPDFWTIVLVRRTWRAHHMRQLPFLRWGAWMRKALAGKAKVLVDSIFTIENSLCKGFFFPTEK